MATLTPEGQDDIGALRNHLKQALTRWESSSQQEADFGQLAMNVDHLLSTMRTALKRQAWARRAARHRIGGRVLLTLALLLAVALLVAGWSTWWLLLPAAAVLTGTYLLVTGGRP